MIVFEWHSAKAVSNLLKHGVSFEEAASVFNDVLAAIYENPDDSTGENRYLIIGTSALGRLLLIANADRRERIRIITREKLRREKGSCMKKKRDENLDELRPEYDLRKLKFVGRGLYAERYRSGTNLVLLEPDVESISR